MIILKAGTKDARLHLMTGRQLLSCNDSKQTGEKIQKKPRGEEETREEGTGQWEEIAAVFCRAQQVNLLLSERGLSL